MIFLNNIVIIIPQFIPSNCVCTGNRAMQLIAVQDSIIILKCLSMADYLKFLFLSLTWVFESNGENGGIICKTNSLYIIYFIINKDYKLNIVSIKKFKKYIFVARAWHKLPLATRTSYTLYYYFSSRLCRLQIRLYPRNYDT